MVTAVVHLDESTCYSWTIYNSSEPGNYRKCAQNDSSKTLLYIGVRNRWKMLITFMQLVLLIKPNNSLSAKEAGICTAVPKLYLHWLQKIAFSDEARILIHLSNGRCRIWQDMKKTPLNHFRMNTRGNGSVMVWRIVF